MDLLKIYDGIRCLVLFAPEGYIAVYERINYLIREKSGITYIVLIIILQGSELIHAVFYL